MLRNASIHGGYDTLHGKALRDRLLGEVDKLYSWDRGCLSLADQDIFKLLIGYRRKQGNQQLMLWVKRAHMLFDNIEEHILPTQQKPITDWLINWDDSVNTSETAPIAKSPNTGCTNKKQTDLTSWITSGAALSDQLCISDDPAAQFSTDGPLRTGKVLDSQTEQITDIVTDGTHQYDTTKKCMLVR
jgi:hypothetical protein